ncbi:teichuronic acid biosynthesis glycosyltransferase TuaH [Bacillus sp. TE9106W]|nr:glycosyltransferase [Bacillus cereus]
MYTYYLIAPSPWQGECGLHYRRHKLTKYLLGLPSTQKVTWIYCIRDETVKEIQKNILPNGICEYGVPSHISQNKEALFTIIDDELEKETHNVLWFTFPEFSKLSELRVWDCITYDCSDLWNKSWTTDEQVDGIPDEIKIIKCADVLVVSSEYLADYIKNIASRSAHVIENMVEFERFHLSIPPTETELDHIPYPRLGFVGGMKEKVDFGLLCSLAEKRPDYNIVLIGPAPFGVPEDLQKLLNFPNVHAMGGRSYDELPNVLYGLNIGLLPYKPMEYNKAVFPEKFFEYLATDLPMVGSGLPSTQKYEEEGVYYLAQSDIEDFINGCEKALKWEQDNKYIEARIKKAEEHNQSHKIKEWVDLVWSTIVSQSTQAK